MLDWKILAASFAALLVVSSVLVGGFGFGDILDKLREWLGDSPFGGFVTTPAREPKAVAIIIFPRNFEFSVDSTDFRAGDADFQGFTGTIQANLSSDTISFSPRDTKLVVTLPLSNVSIDDISIGSLSLSDTDFNVISHALDTHGENATLEIHDFSGRVTISQELVRLDGNVTAVKGNGKDIV
jgi:hypothetical protein